eukprot:SAG11_NODE_2146_length_3752_cov_8.634373_4_plen_153_part_01
MLLLGLIDVVAARLYFSLRRHHSDRRVTIQRLPALLLGYVTAAPPRDYQQHVSEFSAFALYHRGSEFFLHRGLEYLCTAALVVLLGRGDSQGDESARRQCATFEALRAPMLAFCALLLLQAAAMGGAYHAQVHFQRVLSTAGRAGRAARGGGG